MRKKKGNPRDKSSKEHEITLSQVTKYLRWIWDLERLWSFELCLGVNARALVLNVIFRNLRCLELWWLGVFIALNHQSSRWEAVGDGRTRQSGAPPDRHCRLSGAPPRHPTVRVRSKVDRWSFVSLRHQIVWCHIGQSGALWLRGSDFCHGTVHVSASFAVDRCAQIADARWLTGQSGEL
jgi:hypothetical protein